MAGPPKRPYPGLRPFGMDEWEIFFGREVMTEDVVQRLLSNRGVGAWQFGLRQVLAGLRRRIAAA